MKSKNFMSGFIVTLILCSSSVFALPCTLTKTSNFEDAAETGIGGSNIRQTSVQLDSFELGEGNKRKTINVEGLKGTATIGLYGTLRLELTEGKYTTGAIGKNTSGAFLYLSKGSETDVDYVRFALNCAPQTGF